MLAGGSKLVTYARYEVTSVTLSKVIASQSVKTCLWGRKKG
jgi:hypothetical protein